MRKVLYFFLFIIANANALTVYVQKDRHGNIIYSDIHLPNSQKIDVPLIANTTSSPEAVLLVNKTEEIKVISPRYQEFIIVSPRNQETIQNQPTIPVTISLKPELQNGDKIQLLLNDQLIGEAAASTKLTLPLLERGTYQLAAIIVDSQKRVLQKTNTITVFVKRANLNSSPALRPIPRT